MYVGCRFLLRRQVSWIWACVESSLAKLMIVFSTGPTCKVFKMFDMRLLGCFWSLFHHFQAAELGGFSRQYGDHGGVGLLSNECMHPHELRGFEITCNFCSAWSFALVPRKYLATMEIRGALLFLSSSRIEGSVKSPFYIVFVYWLQAHWKLPDLNYGASRLCAHLGEVWTSPSAHEQKKASESHHVWHGMTWLWSNLAFATLVGFGEQMFQLTPVMKWLDCLCTVAFLAFKGWRFFVHPILAADHGFSGLVQSCVLLLLHHPSDLTNLDPVCTD